VTDAFVGVSPPEQNGDATICCAVRFSQHLGADLNMINKILMIEMIERFTLRLAYFVKTKNLGTEKCRVFLIMQRWSQCEINLLKILVRVHMEQTSQK
jgi:hypothetical protein